MPKVIELDESQRIQQLKLQIMQKEGLGEQDAEFKAMAKIQDNPSVF